MSFLEQKIPPLLVTVLFAALMWVLGRLTPDFPTSTALNIIVPLLLAVLAATVGLAGIISFKKAETTVNPLNPDACSSLVVSGIFKWTRNPMYLALLLGLIGWGLFLGNYYSLALTVVFVVYMNRFQIVPEERALENAFGANYLEYRKQVRRWI